MSLFASTNAQHNYAEAFQKSLYFFDGQFSGPKPSWSTANWRADCHTKDGADVGLDLGGGFFDCGDGVNFGLPQYFSYSILGWTMLEYKTTYESTGIYQHALDIMKYSMDFLIRAHPSPNVLYGQKGGGDSDHEVWVPYEFATSYRPSFKVDADCPGSDLAGQASAAMSIGYMIFKDKEPAYAATLLRHSRELFDFAITYQGKYSDCIKDAAGFYASGGYKDEQLWASLWLYKATGEQKYKDYAYTNSREFVKNFMVWSLAWDTCEVGNMYLMAKLFQDKDAIYQTENALEYWSASGLSNGGSVPRTPGGLAFLSAWGVLRHPNIMSYLSLLYVDRTPNLSNDKKQRYINFAKSQIDYVLGSNPLKMSYLVGYGEKWPQRVHHRNAHGSSTNDMTNPDINRHINWIIAGGPDKNDNYPDIRSEYVMSESGMDFQVSFIAGISAMAKHFGGKPLANFPQPESKGLEFFVNSSLVQQNAQTAQGTFFFVGQSSWPPRSPDLQFRVFFKAGIPDLRVQSFYNQNASISGVGSCNQQWDYLNVSFGAGFIYPGSTVSSIKQAQITFSSSGALDLTKDWSFQKVSGTSAMNPNIPTYEKINNVWVKQYGNEPVCISGSIPAPTPAPAPTPKPNPTPAPTPIKGYWKCSVCNN